MTAIYQLLIVDFLGSHIALFISGFLANFMCFNLTSRLVNKIKYERHFTLLAWIFSVMNALLATIINSWTEEIISPLALLWVVIFGMTELYLITEDTNWAYVNLFFLILLDFVCFLGISCGVITLLLDNPWAVASQPHRFAVYSLTMLGAALLFFQIPGSKLHTCDELAELIHERERSRILFYYNFLTSITFLISASITLTLTFNAGIPDSISEAIHWDWLLKAMLAMFTNAVIVIVRARQNREYKELERYEREKEKMLRELLQEKAYRESVQKNALFSYCANITRNDLQEGADVFREELCDREEGYLEIIKHFILYCAHEEDRQLLYVIGSTTYFEEKMEDQSQQVMRMRLSRKRVLEVLNLPTDTKRKLESMTQEWIWAEVNMNLTRDVETGDILSYVNITDATEEVMEEENLRISASTDPLTRLLNRAAMEKQVQEALAEEGEGALFLVDMDNFKNINDKLGHPAGDKAICDTADLLRSLFRSRDMIGRIGGDEFCIFTPGMVQPGLLQSRAEELNCCGARLYSDVENRISVYTTFSIGIAVCRNGNEDYDSLYKKADKALYNAKEDGKNTYHIYQE